MTTSVSLKAVLTPRGEIVHPRDQPRGEAIFVGLEHIESNTGRRTGGEPIRLEELTGRKAHFYPGDIVYGYLRPYLNKVWLADIEGFCSVDQYVFKVDQDLADSGYVAHFMRSAAFLSEAPINITPGQLPRIRTDEVLSVGMWLPPLPEQRAVARRLDEQLILAQRARTAAMASADAAESLRSAILSRAFERKR